MERITLNSITKDNDTIKYDFSVSPDLCKYFSGKPFVIKYEENITSVPNSVAAIAFVCNVLPLIWLTDSELVLNELDKAFLECIPNVRSGYETMFPESSFLGKISVAEIVDNSCQVSNKSALFFSGGLDAVSSLVSHISEKPDLISIWGADIQYDNEQGWDVVYNGLVDSAKRFELDLTVVRSSFRDFDNEGTLNIDFHKQLKDGWWHGIKHGMGLIGHAAVLAYIRNYTRVYIASTYCTDDGNVRSASSPLTDNYIRFVNCQTIHDGFEFCRQDKTQNVVAFQKESGLVFPLRVCWQSQKGDNCCECEKCFRTIMELISECADPFDYGFDNLEQTLPFFRQISIDKKFFYDSVAIGFWKKIQGRLFDNLKVARKTKYWKHIKWILNADFSNPETIKLPLKLRTKNYLYTCKPYILLHKIKTKLIGIFNSHM